MSKKVFYYSNWAQYRSGSGRFTPDDLRNIDATHIIYAFATLNASTLKLELSQNYTDDLRKVVRYRNQGVKVLIAIGGWNDSNEGNIIS